MKLILPLIALWSACALAQSIEIVGPAKKVSLSLKDLKRKLKSQTVVIDDVVYQKTMTYDAFPLADVLALAGASPADKADELVFTALDGYSPNMSFAKLKELHGFLAYEQHGSKSFPTVEQGKTKLSPGPFYVVWQEDVKDSVPWPYQLAKIEVVDWAKKYPRVIPPQASAESLEMKGFQLFKSECIRCHSINMQGGDVGPELNAPQNVTEYWKPDVLRAFIHNAPSFRYKSKMPSFVSLKDDQLDGLIAYLTYMKKFKIAPDRF